jgi:DNA-binding HxlR family transcriptional regulator
MSRMAKTKSPTRTDSEPECSIERCLLVLSDRWSFLIMREALMADIERFADFQARLGIAPNVLTARLESLVDAGVMTKRSYQEPGKRRRQSYHLTAAGRDLVVPLVALQQWGDEHDPPSAGPSLERLSPTGSPVRVALLDTADELVSPEELAFARPAGWVGVE